MKVLDDPQFLKLDFYTAVISEILGTLDAEFCMPAMILASCCIDYMIVPLAGAGTNTRVHFKKFVSDYMGAANKTYQSTDMQDIIYAVRCALVHVYGGADATEKLNVRPIFEVGPFARHLIRDPGSDGVVDFHISIPHFVAEVVTGVEKFFRETTDTGLFNAWYKKLIILSGISGAFLKLNYAQSKTIVYGRIHPLISCFDSPVTDYSQLSIAIADSFLKKHGYWLPELTKAQ